MISNLIVVNKWYNFIIKNSSDYDIIAFENFELERHLECICENLEKVQWREKINDELLLHYIIPPRITQEPLDNFTIIYKDTLFEIIKDTKNMREAVLRINEWCFTKMEYKPTERWDFNASSVIKSGYGRCEEMSILLIKALRTVCIPARFAYTPIWPFTESNHAWTEVWIDGKWHYIGSAELSDIDFPWFRKPVKRTALVLTPVFGKIKDKNIVKKRKNWCIINSTENYTDICNVKIITTMKGKKIKNSIVSFSVFNFGSLYPVIIDTLKKVDCSLKIGFNEYFVYVSKDSFLCYRIFLPEKEYETIYLELNKKNLPDTSFFLHCTKEKDDTAKPSYTPNVDSLKSIKENNLKNISSEDTIFLFKNAMGNRNKLFNFFMNLNEEEKKNFIEFFKNINQKDLVFMDTINLKRELYVIDNALKLKKTSIPDSIVENYLIPERILYEEFTFYKFFLYEKFEYLLRKENIPEKVFEWVKKNVKEDKEYNFFKPQQNPIFTYKLRKGNNLERYILIAGILRSIGIPSKIKWDYNGVNYFENGWKTFSFDSVSLSKTTLNVKFLNDNINITKDFEYYDNYTIQKIKGFPLTMEPDIIDQDSIKIIYLENELYYIVSGFRNINGDAFVNIRLIDLRKKDEKKMEIGLGIPNEFKKGDLIMKDFKPEKFKELGLNIDKGNVLIIFLDINSEASRSTITNAKEELNSFEGILYFIGKRKEIMKFLKEQNISNGIIIDITEENLKRLGIQDFPSILFLKDSELVFWIEGFSLHLKNFLK